MKWSTAERVFRSIEVLAIVAGIVIGLMQLNDIRNMQSADLMLRLDEKITTPRNEAFATAIEDDAPLFSKNGGPFTDSDADNYLGVYELISNVYGVHLLKDEMLYNAFSYDMIKTYQNKEVAAYLERIRKDDADLYRGFEEMATALEKAK